jgi:ABC-type phosphate transport system substrate-binding protein
MSCRTAIGSLAAGLLLGLAGCGPGLTPPEREASASAGSGGSTRDNGKSGAGGASGSTTSTPVTAGSAGTMSAHDAGVDLDAGSEDAGEP